MIKSVRSIRLFIMLAGLWLGLQLPFAGSMPLMAQEKMAQAQREYRLDWWSVDGGGGVSTGGGFSLQGSIAQPDAGSQRAGSLLLRGGLWSAASATDLPPIDEPPVDNPPVDEPPIDEPPVDTPSTGEPKLPLYLPSVQR